MADFGVTPTGFVPMRLADIRADLQTKLNAITDPVSGESLNVDLEDNSVVSQIAGIFAEALADCWNAASLAYLQFDPRYNTGAGQSGTVQINGLLRHPPTATELLLELGGTVGATIPAGSLVSTLDQVSQFATAEDVTIGAGGTVSVAATCTVSGATQVIDDDSPMQIASPARGWLTASCLSTSVQGAAEETDEQLRIRQQVSTSETAYRQIDAIYAGILNVAGVTYCRVYQNNTLSSDSRGIPAKTIAAVVNGGADEDIADELFMRVPIGVAYYGGTTVTITDRQGIQYAVKFQRPIPVPVDVAVAVQPLDSTFPSDTFVTDIQNAIIAFAAGGPRSLGITQGFDAAGFPPGNNVVLSLLYTAVNSVSGVQVCDMLIALHGGALSEQTVEIAWNEAAEFTTGNIAVYLATSVSTTTSTSTTTTTTTGA